jgi:hypothetical protein
LREAMIAAGVAGVAGVTGVAGVDAPIGAGRGES